MKNHMLLALALTLLYCSASLSTTALGATEKLSYGACMTSKNPSAKNGKQGLLVNRALSKLPLINGNINKKAKYYFFLQAAGWCDICCQKMPDIVKEYRNMKRAGVELVLFSHDKTEEEALDFITEYNMRFPVTMDRGDNVPGFQRAVGIPNLIIVDEFGNQIAKGHPSALLPNWEEIIEKGQEQAADADSISSGNAGGSCSQQVVVSRCTRKVVVSRCSRRSCSSGTTSNNCTPSNNNSACEGNNGAEDSNDTACEGDNCTEDSNDTACEGNNCTEDSNDTAASAGNNGTEDSNTAASTGNSTSGARSLAELEYINTQPNPGADYYVYLKSASWCPYCRLAMPTIVNEYDAMRNENIEIVLFCYDHSSSDAQNYINQYNATFPTTMDHGNSMPGMTRSGGIPYVTIVDKNGTTIAEGHPTIIIPQWRTLIAQDKSKKQGM